MKEGKKMNYARFAQDPVTLSCTGLITEVGQRYRRECKKGLGV